MVNGEEVKRYKNIELPDELKEMEMYNLQCGAPILLHIRGLHKV